VGQVTAVFAVDALVGGQLRRTFRIFGLGGALRFDREALGVVVVLDILHPSSAELIDFLGKFCAVGPSVAVGDVIVRVVVADA